MCKNDNVFALSQSPTTQSKSTSKSGAYFTVHAQSPSHAHIHHHAASTPRRRRPASRSTAVPTPRAAEWGPARRPTRPPRMTRRPLAMLSSLRVTRRAPIVARCAPTQTRSPGDQSSGPHWEAPHLRAATPTRRPAPPHCPVRAS
jgi:hypothetical protein